MIWWKMESILFAGPGLSGKTTCISFLADQSKQPASVQSVAVGPTYMIEAVISMPWSSDSNRQLVLRSAPGAVFFEPLYRRLATEADAIVFVVDSQEPRLEENQRCLSEYETYIREAGRDPSVIPWILQLNKRDHPLALPAFRLLETLNRSGRPFYETVATQGIGLVEVLAKARQLIDAARCRGA